MTRGRRDPARERAWRERVGRWTASGLSVRAFCRQQGLIETSFYYWKRELRARDAAVGGRAAAGSRVTPLTAACPSGPKLASTKVAVAKSGSVLPLFVPVTVLPDSTDSMTAGSPALLSVEVRCPSGHVVLLPACDAAWLASVFAALTPPERETPSC